MKETYKHREIICDVHIKHSTVRSYWQLSKHESPFESIYMGIMGLTYPQLNCIFNSLFKKTTKETRNLHTAGPCMGPIDSTHKGPARFPTKRASNAFPYNDVIVQIYWALTIWQTWCSLIGINPISFKARRTFKILGTLSVIGTFFRIPYINLQ